MNKKIIILFAIICIAYTSCKVPQAMLVSNSKSMPTTFKNNLDSTTNGNKDWRTFFEDPYLNNLIDTAPTTNYELLMMLQENEIAKNEILQRSAKLLPTVEGRGGLGVDKAARYTSQGAGDASTEMTPGKKVNDFLADQNGGAYASWEIDIWHKLRNAKKAAVTRYLATQEGRKFFMTNLVAEIANSYYELLALDNQLLIVKDYENLQGSVLKIVRIQKEAVAATELAVKKYEAEVLNTKTKQYVIEQKIAVIENKINFLLGRCPQSISRNPQTLTTLALQKSLVGIPAQLLENRTDIKQSELELEASKIDVQVARAEFLPSLNLSAGLGLQAFNPAYLIKLPESILLNLAGDIAGPLINKKAIQAEFNNANARQLQALYNYQKTILNAFIEVHIEMDNIENFENIYKTKKEEVATLNKSTDIANQLFKYARADYLEVLMTQRDALDAQLELVEMKQNQFASVVNLYRALGGGWQ